MIGFLTLTESARLLGVSRTRVRWFLAEGTLTVAERVGRVQLLRTAEVEALVTQRGAARVTRR